MRYGWLRSAPSRPVVLEQRRRQVAGLAIVALVILALSIWRAGVPTVFPPGWWRF